MAELEQHAQRAWSFFASIGSPKLHVAPMVDQSELPFRMLCRRHGATAAYTPMLHSRLFAEDEKYRAEMFSTCPEDRPLFVQFCSNDPDYLVKAAKHVEPFCDAVDLNFGCPQRIAKRGYYGAFLMDNLPLVERLVRTLVQNVSKPISCKIRVFPELQRTIEYAKMIERAGCSVLAVHGRTREMKDNSRTRADWDAIRAVKAALRIPVLANGNIRHLADAEECMRYTGCDGVLSAESLLEDPALFAPRRALHEGAYRLTDAPGLAREYLELCGQYPVPLRMVKGHLFKILNPWLQEFVDLRAKLGNDTGLGLEGMVELVEDAAKRISGLGRDHPQPALNERQLARLAKEAALKAAIEEQEREAAALAAVGADPLDPPATSAATPTTSVRASTHADSTANGVPIQQHGVECCDVPSSCCEDFASRRPEAGPGAHCTTHAAHPSQHPAGPLSAAAAAAGINGCTASCSPGCSTHDAAAGVAASLRHEPGQESMCDANGAKRGCCAALGECHAGEGSGDEARQREGDGDDGQHRRTRARCDNGEHASAPCCASMQG